MPNKPLLITALLAVPLLAPWPVEAARFVLADGEVVEGQVIALTRNTVTVRPDIGGIRQISADEVEEVEVSGSSGTLDRIVDDRLVIRTADDRELWIEDDRVVADNPAPRDRAVRATRMAPPTGTTAPRATTRAVLAPPAVQTAIAEEEEEDDGRLRPGRALGFASEPQRSDDRQSAGSSQRTAAARSDSPDADDGPAAQTAATSPVEQTARAAPEEEAAAPDGAADADGATATAPAGPQAADGGAAEADDAPAGTARGFQRQGDFATGGSFVGLVPQAQAAPAPDERGMPEGSDPPLVRVEVLKPMVEEVNGTIGFKIELSKASDRPVKLVYATVDGEATAGEDYEASQGVFTLQPGETSRSIEAKLLDDSDVEEAEQFFLFITADTEDALLEEKWYTVTIQDND